MPDTYEYGPGPSVYMSGHSEWIIRRKGKPGIIASITGHEDHAKAAVAALDQAAKHDEFSTRVVTARADLLAAALHLALYEAHPAYGSTATWHGGIGGQMITQGCSFNDPPPQHEWMREALAATLRGYVNAYAPDLTAAIQALREADQDADR